MDQKYESFFKFYANFKLHKLFILVVVVVVVEKLKMF